jgi:hypothetical protein
MRLSHAKAARWEHTPRAAIEQGCDPLPCVGLNHEPSLLLGQRAYQAARHGTIDDAKDVLRAYAHERRWVTETRRVPWDGSAALLEWGHALEPVARPPFGRFYVSDARAIVSYFEAKGVGGSPFDNQKLPNRRTCFCSRSCLGVRKTRASLVRRPRLNC